LKKKNHPPAEASGNNYFKFFADIA